MRLIRLLFAFCCLATGLFAQGLTSLAGTVTDPTGAVIPNATLTITNVATSATREAQSDAQGRYTFAQVTPGTYRLNASAAGFSNEVFNNVQLLVNQPATIDVSLKLGQATAATVEVSAEAAQVNTENATLGNAVGGTVVTQLPFESRNVVGLLAIQPGVVYLGETNPGQVPDPRNGSVEGGKSDQGNVTLDGVDVNDQQTRASFTSVLRVTLDSVQEFRTITTNAGAEYGHSSGAQVTLVTKSGTNAVHGSLYEYLRNTDTSANLFFNNAAGIATPKLNRNVYGASVGGPIKKDKLFYFANYEGRKDASAATVLRTVPTATLRSGEVLYTTKSGGVGTETADQIRALDPLGIGVDPASLQYFNQYPLPNDNTVGDGLNTAGYRFNASEPLRYNTYIAKVDYQLSNSNSIFVRGNLQNDNYQNQAPQFPGEPANGVFLDNSKGLAAGLTSIITPTFVSTLRYGFTREGVQNTGVLASSYSEPTYGSISTLYGTTTGSFNIIPVNDVHEDLTWTKGAHTLSFGAEILLIKNNYGTNAQSFSSALGDGQYLAQDGFGLLNPDAVTSMTNVQAVNDLLGVLSKNQLDVNYNLQGQTLPLGATIIRNFGEKHFDLYAQDSWKITRGLTVSLGLRVGLNPAIQELNGYNVDTTPQLGTWLAERAGLAAAGQSQAAAGNIQIDLSSATGRSLYPFQTDWAPRGAIAYSPQGTTGLSKLLFGGPDHTSIRVGWGMYYDAFGQGLERSVANSVGFSTQVHTGPGEPIDARSPRFTGFYELPPLSYFPPAPAGGFPQTAQLGLMCQCNAFDDQLKAPYTENFNFSIERQLPKGFLIQASFVNRESKRSLTGEDFATPTNLVDTQSGMTYYQAVAALAPYVYAKAPATSVPNVAFWQNLWPTAAGNGLTATQNIYKMAYLPSPGDWTTALLAVDVNCNTNGTLTSSALPCSKLGPYSMFNSQYIALNSLRSVGWGSYNGLHLTVRKAFSQGYQFDFNYTFSRCEDLSSGTEYGGVGSSNFIQQIFDQVQSKAVCNYDVPQLFSGLAVADLPFGQGKPFLNTTNKFVNGVLGGWQVSGVLTIATAFPVSVGSSGVYPTEWDFNAYATQTGIVPSPSTTENAPSAIASQKGGPNLFAQPGLAYAAYSQTPAGQSGQRNGIFGEGPFSIDISLAKRFHLFNFHDQPHSLTFRAEAFNVSNTVRFDPSNANLNIGNQAKFGQYTQQLGTSASTGGGPRVFQFSARYEF